MAKIKESILKRFGKYLLLDHLVDGGMAKICRARYLGEEADRIVAIKMIQAQYSEDESFKIMFMNEIKVTFGLIHPNIVQTYDYGLNENKLYVAMEYCDGKNLKEYLDKLKKRKFVFPVDISVHIITQVCQGLNYAHHYVDKMTGKKTNIIHRDISPHNIMLTYDGAVKVIDFGIAKAETNQDATKVGTIKGKLSYIAPEYIEGKKLDHRYDQFAVGITLWELLCSRKLFDAKNDLAILKMIQDCRIPAPSSINPNVPEELDAIVLKALSRDRNNRYENMDQLNRALVKFLYKNYEEFNVSDLGYFAKELFSEDIKSDQEKMFEYGKMDISEYLKAAKLETEEGRAPGKERVEKKNVQENQILDFGFAEEKIEEQNAARTSRRDKAAPQPMKDLGLSGHISHKKKLGLNATRAKNLNLGERKTRTAFEALPEHTRTRSRTEQEKKRSKGEGPVNKMVVAILVLFAVYFGYEKFGDIILDKTKRVPSSSKKGTPPKVQKKIPNKMGVISLNGHQRRSHRVFLNGKRVKVSVLGEIHAEAGEYYLRIESPGRETFVKKIILRVASPINLSIPNMPRAGHGFLKNAADPNCKQGTLYFTLNGEDRIERVPTAGNRGIVLPVGKEIMLEYKMDGQDFKRKLLITIKNENDIKDFCDINIKYKK